MFYITVATVTGVSYLVMLYNTVTTVEIIASDINKFLSYFSISLEFSYNCNTVTSVVRLSG